MRPQLTLKRVRARPVVVPLKRPVVSKVGQFTDWPLILIDLYTNEGVVGHSYLEPYLAQSARYIVPAIEDLAEAGEGQPVAPFDAYRRGVGSLQLVGDSILPWGESHRVLLQGRRGGYAPRSNPVPERRSGWRLMKGA